MQTFQKIQTDICCLFIQILTNWRRTAGGVAAVLAGCLWTAPTDVLEPRFRGNVCDLLATARLTGRLVPMVSFRPDAVNETI